MLLAAHRIGLGDRLLHAFKCSDPVIVKLRHPGHLFGGQARREARPAWPAPSTSRRAKIPNSASQNYRAEDIPLSSTRLPAFWTRRSRMRSVRRHFVERKSAGWAETR